MPRGSLPIRPFLLDTHIWIWALEGNTRELNMAAQDAIGEGGATGRVLVSPISCWEVGMLEAKGRIRFTVQVSEWMRRALQAPGVTLAPLTPEIALDSSRLPGTVHGDPADRILIATARRTGALLVTRDHQILEYAREGHLSVVDAGA